MTRSNAVAVATVQQPPRNIVLHGDCLDVLRTLPDCSVDAVVTDPPAGIEFMGKEWDTFKQGRLKNYKKQPGGKVKQSKGEGADFADRMGALPPVNQRANQCCLNCGHYRYSGTPCTCEQPRWKVDTSTRDTFIAFMSDVMRECMRVVKPGGHALVWALPRTSHWTACALEDAGWEIRDCLYHIFGSGFPKSLDVSKAIDRAAGAERTPTRRVAIPRRNRNGTNALGGGWQDEPWETAPATSEAQTWQGWGTALKPAVECWWLCRKPLAAGNVAANVLAYGTGAIHVDACRVATDTNDPNRRDNASIDRSANQSTWNLHKAQRNPTLQAGRWPANLLLTHAADCTQAQCVSWCPAAVLDGQSGERKSPPSYQRNNPVRNDGKVYGVYADRDMQHGYGDTGGASRYFAQFYYSAKASRAERGDFNTHPTVKSLSLMRWLCRLITPSGGTVLDPFGGSGSTAVAAVAEAFGYVLIERDADYVEIIRRRVAHAEATAKTPQPQPRKPARKKPQPQRITPIAATVATVEQSSLWRMEA